jgi:hypothetical protein
MCNVYSKFPIIIEIVAELSSFGAIVKDENLNTVLSNFFT